MVPMTPQPSRNGFSLIEVITTVMILGILAALVIDAGLRDWRRAQVNTVVVELAGWLESVRRAALKGSSCTVTIHTPQGLPNLAESQPTAGVATAVSSPCRALQPLQLTTITPNAQFTISATPAQFTFTPAGTFRAASNPAVITVELSTHSDTKRCIQIEGMLGYIGVGRPENGGGCNTNTRF